MYILTHVTLKSRSNQRSIYQLVHTRHGQAHLRCKFGDHRSVTYTTHTRIFYDDLKPSKVGLDELVLLCDQGSLVGLYMQRLQVFVYSG